VDREAPIGVFDSGVGGLTVVREIIRQLPNENVVYFGDTARVPYGNKSKNIVIDYSRQIIHFLKTKKVKAIVIACNTASAYALDTVAPETDIPVMGVVLPGAKAAAEATKNGHIGILGTIGTVNSGIYTEVLHRYNPAFQVVGKACPLFVPLVEEGMLEDSVTDEMAARYIKPLIALGVDTLVLGCTHYPLIRSTIRKIAGEQVQLVNPAYETAISLRSLLQEKGIYRDSGEPQYRFYVSDGAEKFSSFANSILPVELVETKLVPIEEY